MTRPVIILSLLMLAATPATGQNNPSSSDSLRLREMTPSAPEKYPSPSIEVGPGGRFGFGMFRLKPDAVRGRAVTVREVNEPRNRRAGVGFSLNF